jgi:hypothetical protein
MLDKFQELPQLFITGSFTDNQMQGRREVQRLKELRELFKLGLREIADAVFSERISHFNCEEIERIVEARFEKTQLRESIMKSINKAIEMQQR